MALFQFPRFGPGAKQLLWDAATGQEGAGLAFWILSETEAPVHTSQTNCFFWDLGKANLPPLVPGLPVAFLPSFPFKAAL